MKKIIFLFFLIPFFASAQDCQVKKETDPYTHETKISSGFFAIGTGIGHALLSIDADSKEINLLFSLNGSNKCFDDASTAVILFDGSKIKTNLRNTAPMNCDGTFNINFRNGAATPTQLQKLSVQKVTTIRLTSNEKNSTDINLSDEQKTILMNMAACIIKESKTLIKP